MKKIILLIAASAFMSVAANSMLPKEVTIPVLPAETFRLQTRPQKGLILFKDASSDSPQLYHGFSNEWRKQEEPVVYYWSDEAIPDDYKSYRELISGESGQLLPLQKSSGWIRIWYSDRPVWISESNFESFYGRKIVPITVEDNVFSLWSPTGEDGTYRVYVRPSGKYSGLLTFVYKYGGIEGICFGYIINGMAIFPAMLPAKVQCSYGSTGGLTVNAPRPKSPFYEVNFPTKLSDGYSSLDFNKLTDEELSSLLVKAKCADNILVGYQLEGYTPRLMWFNPKLWPLKTLTVPFTTGSYPAAPSTVEEVETVATAVARQQQRLTRTVNNPHFVNEATATTRVSSVRLTPQFTSITITFTPASNFQYNINRGAYITCNQTDTRYSITSVQGANLSPKPTQARRGVEEVVTMYFEPVPLESTVINLVEGPSRDNININGIEVPITD